MIDHDKFYIMTVKQAHKLNRARYILPPADALRMLRPGFVVKVLVDCRHHANKAEEIWVAITNREADSFIGMVYDTLGRTPYHGLSKGCPLQFKTAHILDILFQGKDKNDDGVHREYKLI